MTELLSRLFVRDRHNIADPAVRLRYGTMVSIVSMLCNFLLAVMKFLIGTLVGSIVITADAVNNLSDSGSSLVSFVSFRIAAKPADRDHPFGHARIEYVASMIVSFLILLVGAELLLSSGKKIFDPSRPDDTYMVASIVILTISIAVKLWLGLFNYRIGKRIDSSVMRAAATDSLMDCVSTAAALLSTVLTLTLDWYFLDGYFGVFVAVLIIVAGCKILNETKNSILGERPVAETVSAIRRIVSEYPEALGIHDLIVHSYGPGHSMASLHVEVDGARDVYETHDMIDNIERRLGEELGILCTIHADPIVVGDSEVDRLHELVQGIVNTISPELHMHDFRFVRGTTHHNLIFDIATPFEFPLRDDELRERIAAAVVRENPLFRTVVTVDRE
ncbi:MAG: cation transporter [Clostridia bacterium]|nr:cation transporter [Clostridia bacterium]